MYYHQDRVTFTVILTDLSKKLPACLMHITSIRDLQAVLYLILKLAELNFLPLLPFHPLRSLLKNLGTPRTYKDFPHSALHPRSNYSASIEKRPSPAGENIYLINTVRSLNVSTNITRAGWGAS